MTNLYRIYDKVGNTSALVFRMVLLLENCDGLSVIFHVSCLPTSVCCIGYAPNKPGQGMV